MDFALERLVQDESCRTSAGEIVVGETCKPDQLAFKQIVSQYALAIAPSAMYPARTTGYGGFEISLEGLYTTVDGDADYMKRGTRGPTDPVTGEASRRNDSPASMLQLYSVRLRKGFGFGLEVGTQFGWLADTSLISGGADLRIAILEGFRDGFAGYLPDLAVAGSVRTITGTSQVQITVPSVQGVISKPITIADSGQLTPWFGYQYLWMFGDSGILDFTPATDPQQYCNYSGQNQPGGPTNPIIPERDGSPVCAGGSPADFNNSSLFLPVRLERQRFFVGLNYQYEVFVVGGQVFFDPFGLSKTQDNAEDAEDLRDVKSQVSFALQLSASF